MCVAIVTSLTWFWLLLLLLLLLIIIVIKKIIIAVIVAAAAVIANTYDIEQLLCTRHISLTHVIVMMLSIRHCIISIC